jgi:acetyl-CoA synthetase
MSEKTIENLLTERRTFPPPAEFRARAVVSSEEVYERAERDPEGFWAA